MTIVLIVLSLLLPPVAAFLLVGFGRGFWLNLILTICGFLPGQVHAVWMVLDKNKKSA